jgi:hypothetical protein
MGLDDSDRMILVFEDVQRCRMREIDESEARHVISKTGLVFINLRARALILTNKSNVN